jgi:hypothetical protein
MFAIVFLPTLLTRRVTIVEAAAVAAVAAAAAAAVEPSQNQHSIPSNYLNI